MPYPASLLVAREDHSPFVEATLSVQAADERAIVAADSRERREES
jgi:hypothetical protein